MVHKFKKIFYYCFIYGVSHVFKSQLEISERIVRRSGQHVLRLFEIRSKVKLCLIYLFLFYL